MLKFRRTYLYIYIDLYIQRSSYMYIHMCVCKFEGMWMSCCRCVSMFISILGKS